MRTLALTLITLLAVVAIVTAQQEPIPVSEYRGNSSDRERFTEAMRSFVDLLEKQPKSMRGAIAYINGFRFQGPCVDNRRVEDKSFAEFVRSNIPSKYRKRVVLVPSDQWGLLEEAEFYLVPAGTNLPRRIERIVEPPCCCSEISIDGRNEIESGSQKVRYSLVLPMRSKRVTANPNWVVSSGKIISGQGTDSIEVDLTGSLEKKISVEVSITSPSPVCGCPTTGVFTTRIKR
jgi:hypothetical protein